MSVYGDGKRVTWWRRPLRAVQLAFTAPKPPPPPQGREFEDLTGLHPVYSRFTWERRIIREQATTIRNLRAERDQQRRAYERKIAKLQRRLAPLPAPSGSDGIVEKETGNG